VWFTTQHPSTSSDDSDLGTYRQYRRKLSLHFMPILNVCLPIQGNPRFSWGPRSGYGSAKCLEIDSRRDRFICRPNVASAMLKAASAVSCQPLVGVNWRSHNGTMQAKLANRWCYCGTESGHTDVCPTFILEGCSTHFVRKTTGQGSPFWT